MGTNIPRPTRRPPTPAISDQPYGSKTNEAVLKAFNQFHAAAQDLIYHDTDLDQKVKDRRTNCPNCCAVITGPICEYCGTRFGGYDPGDPKGDAMIIPVYIGSNCVGEIFKKNDSRFRSGGV